MTKAAASNTVKCFPGSGEGIQYRITGGCTFGGEHAPHTMTKRALMTKHRLIRCSPSALLDTAYIGHTLIEDRAFDTLQHWRQPAESERGNAVHWYDHVPVIGDVGCCLSVDRGATGAVAHLIATAPLQRRVLPRPLVRLALSSWSHRKLIGLAKVAETQAIDLPDAL
jgi:hypothetical protein